MSDTKIHNYCGTKDCECTFINHPKAQFWHPTKNGELKPGDVSRRSDCKFWFYCIDCKHNFLISISNIMRGGWCKYCNNWEHCGNEICEFCFNNSFSSHHRSKDWLYEKNNNINPLYVYKFTNKKFWLHCTKCCHNNNPTLASITKGGCVYCSPRWKHCGDEKCNFCFKKSFASHPKSVYLRGSENNDIDPLKLSKYNGNVVCLFYCDKCNHIFKRKLVEVYKGVWCNYCSVRWKHCGDEKCVFCFNRSFASSPRITSWSKELNDVNPLYIPKSTTQKFWFNCKNCKHSVKLALHDVTSGNWCYYCSQTWKHCGDEKCEYCFNRSFASHPKSKYWNQIKNGSLKPINIAKGSGTMVWMTCNECGIDFNISLHYVTTSNVWCYCVNNMTENKLRKWLQDCYPVFTIETQKRFEWCRSIKSKKIRLPYDFYIPELNLIIELDGRQHAIQVWNWTSPKEQQERDIYKMKKAIENDLSIIRIYQVDVAKDINDWENKLVNAIENCVDKRVTCIRTNQDFINEVYEKYETLNETRLITES